MSEPHKKIKKDNSIKKADKNNPDFDRLYTSLMQASKSSEEHPFGALLGRLKAKKHPILQVIHPQNDIYKTNP